MNRFFTVDDKELKKMDDFKIPTEWWSRTREYKWCSDFLNKDEIILDAGCGIEHPFKTYSANGRVKKCYAVDKDERLNDLEENDNLEYIVDELTNLKNHFKNNTFDKIFCISVLEHIHVDIVVEILKQFKDLLKPDGNIVLTIDYPFLLPEKLVKIVEDIGLEFFGEIDYSMDSDKILKGQYSGLRCYRALLRKKGTNEPLETKPEFPKTTKKKRR